MCPRADKKISINGADTCRQSVPFLHGTGWNAVKHVDYQRFRVFTKCKLLIIKLYRICAFWANCYNLLIISMFQF